MATKSRKKAKKTKAKRKPAKAAKRTKVARKTKKTTKAKAKKKKAPARRGVAKTVKKAAKRLVAAAKRVVSPKKKKKDVIGEGNYTAARNFRKEETSFIDNNRDVIARKAKEAEAAIDGPEGAELEQAREETGSRGKE